jgi:hypothetical protein
MILFSATIEGRADPTAISRMAAEVCSGSQDIDFESTTGNAKYKDLQIEITDAGKTLKLKNKGVLLAEIKDYSFEKYSECLQTIIKQLGSIQ